MKNLNTKTLLAASIASLITVNASSATLTDATIMKFDHPQSIAISDATDTLNGNTTSVAQTTWTVTSNNAVELLFTGSSKDATGGNVDEPIFHKQEVDARGAPLSTYDHLTTSFGVVISGAQSIETNDGNTTWGSGATAASTPANLVGTADSADTARHYYKAIMPNDAGTFTLDLYAKGTGNASSTQSGDYTATVTTTLVASEK